MGRGIVRRPARVPISRSLNEHPSSIKSSPPLLFPEGFGCDLCHVSFVDTDQADLSVKSHRAMYVA
jgi:hypothetical protein